MRRTSCDALSSAFQIINSFHSFIGLKICILTLINSAFTSLNDTEYWTSYLVLHHSLITPNVRVHVTIQNLDDDASKDVINIFIANFIMDLLLGAF
jgi:hypothetical protein